MGAGGFLALLSFLPQTVLDSLDWPLLRLAGTETQVLFVTRVWKRIVGQLLYQLFFLFTNLMAANLSHMILLLLL